MLKYLIAAALLVAPLTAAAQDSEPPEWYYVGTTTQGSKVRARWVDLMKGRSDQTDARVWIMTDDSKNTTVAHRQMKAYHSVNCVKQTYTLLTMTLYFPSGRVETVQGTNDTQYIVPGTIMDSVAELLCFSPSSSSRTNPVSDNYTS